MANEIRTYKVEVRMEMEDCQFEVSTILVRALTYDGAEATTLQACRVLGAKYIYVRSIMRL